jgi:hypothetical protein
MIRAGGGLMHSRKDHPSGLPCQGSGTKQEKLRSISVMVRVVCSFLAALHGPSLGGRSPWLASVKTPLPAVGPVTIDQATTELLLLDFSKQACSAEHGPAASHPFRR